MAIPAHTLNGIRASPVTNGARRIKATIALSSRTFVASHHTYSALAGSRTIVRKTTAIRGGEKSG
jgi:hypothetical protein